MLTLPLDPGGVVTPPTPLLSALSRLALKVSYQLLMLAELFPREKEREREKSKLNSIICLP